MTTVQRNGLVFNGSTKYDRGYIRPRILDGAASGGTGGTAGAYGGNAPPIAGTDGQSAVDTDTGRIWWYYGGQWN